MKNTFAHRYGPWAVVTGASSGIGRAIAWELATRGLNLFLVARDKSVLHSLAGEIMGAHGIAARAVPLDLGLPEANKKLFAATEAEDVGLLVAAAGFGTSGEFVSADLAAEQAMLAVNVGAVLEQCHHYGNRLVRRGRGGMILFGSLVGYQGTPRAAHYAATKAFVQSLAEGLHVELAPHGVHVLSSAPGPVRSGFGRRADMRMGAAEDPGTVARATVRALGRRMTVTPGFLSKFLTWSLATAPRSLRVRIMGAVMAGMTRPVK